MLNGGKEKGQWWWRRERDDPMFERNTSDKATVHPKLKFVLFMHTFTYTYISLLFL